MSLKMKADVLDEVVRRLRSGEYAQGSGYLRVNDPEKGDEYCCLGIICEMAAEAGVVERVEPGGRHRKAFQYHAPGESRTHASYLPPAVIEWAGMVSDVERRHDDEYHYEEQGSFGEDHYQSLAYMNDNGAPFADIATFMENSVERV